MALKIGCCGFAVGQSRYAQEFRVVEVQQTFYQVPSLATLARWRERLPPPFEFTLKAWQLITHEASSPTYRRLSEKLTTTEMRRCGAFRPSDEVHKAWERTVEAAGTLGARVVLFQCPASFTPTEEHIENLTRFFHSVDRRGFRFAWEPRGAWELDVVRRLCRKLDLVHAVDPLQQKVVAGEFRYFRLHGRGGYRYHYTDSDLRQLVRACRGRSPVYAFFNNAYMWEDAQRFRQLWEHRS